ncbi:hypothetical protein BXT86_04750 [candidate division WOR-3 bacterium 4484_100]|uniref:Lipoprotein n=1 Tax=candidate division WOR-3 bacterium 4484_100 TaxID=1936077 RepID=A0A1V4QFY1_UNCW3|nr:MAG: hypothetical protein BXT86_04750 [candidate division WOR-3 bacterium 4484_100]
MFLKILVVMVSIVIAGCMLFRPSISVDRLLSAPEQIEIDGRNYILETHLWRDFMPVSPPDGKPLIALIRITATDSLEFPPSIDARLLWVIKSPQEVWETKFSEEARSTCSRYQLEKVARKGPKWGPGIEVDVVVKIVDGENEYLLRASNQVILRTD